MIHAFIAHFFVRQYTIAARSKLKNFAPKILLCAGLIVLSVRNANIVSDGKASAMLFEAILVGI